MSITLDHIGAQVVVTGVDEANDSFEITAGSNRHLVVVVWSHDANPACDHVEYNGVALTQRVALSNSGTQNKRVEVWSLANPSGGTHTVHVHWTYTQDKGGFKPLQLNGVNNGNPIKDFDSVGGLGAGATRTVDASTPDMVVGGVILAPDTAAITLGAGQTLIDSDLWDAHDIRWKHSYESGESDGSTTHSYTWTGDYNYACVAVAFRALVLQGRPIWMG